MNETHPIISSKKRKFNTSYKPQKKQKLNNQTQHIHPLGVLPLGNLYLNDDGNIARTIGLGSLNCLNDDIVTMIIAYLDYVSLATLCSVSKALYCYATLDFLWKEFVLDNYNGDFSFRNTWRETFIFKKKGKILSNQTPFKVKGLYSDNLYNAWYCANIDPYIWAGVDTIERRSNLSLEEFIAEYAIPNKPVIITDIVTKWPSYNIWSNEYLCSKYGDIKFKTDAQIDMKLVDYLKYSGSTIEERAIYLFDNSFVERAPDIQKEFEVPFYFKQDHFDLLNDIKDGEESIRPSYRWLLVGPKKAGATFHKDPNWTSAWHGLISGKKKWIMFPPDFVPPGVFPSADGLEVTVPNTMVQWFVDFYKIRTDVKPLECDLVGGELMFIPSGWWHSVINLEESVAVTQNFVNDFNFSKVYKFLSTKNSKKLFEEFHKHIHSNQPNLLSQIEASNNNSKNDNCWDDLVGNEEQDSKWTLSF